MVVGFGGGVVVGGAVVAVVAVVHGFGGVVVLVVVLVSMLLLLWLMLPALLLCLLPLLVLPSAHVKDHNKDHMTFSHAYDTTSNECGSKLSRSLLLTLRLFPI